MLENATGLPDKGQSDKKQSDENLRRSEALMRAVFNTNSELQCVTSIFGVFVDANRAFCEASGLAREDILGKTSNDVNLWVDLGRRQEFLETLGQNGAVDCFDADMRDADGRVHRCQLSAKVLKVGGTPLVLTCARDVSGFCGD